MSPTQQLELGLPRERVPDRNAAQGGRSFYFFDLDDNVFTLETPIFIFEASTRAEVELSTRRFALVGHLVGKPGPWQSYVVDPDDHVGSFRRFRDHPLESLDGRPQPFIEDLRAALGKPEVTWKGPSWQFFEHAVFNQRPMAIITARGHHPDTIRAGLGLLHQRGFITAPPPLMAVYPVSHVETRRRLGDERLARTIPELKKAAILDAVQGAMAQHGDNPFHRFGISDDAPENVELSLEAMRELKCRYPKNAFFVIDASRYPVTFIEVFCDHDEPHVVESYEQLELF
jgi:hypothetical protein